MIVLVDLKSPERGVPRIVGTHSTVDDVFNSLTRDVLDITERNKQYESVMRKNLGYRGVTSYDFLTIDNQWVSSINNGNLWIFDTDHDGDAGIYIDFKIRLEPLIKTLTRDELLTDILKK